jgi:hypothetical protein
MKSRCPFLALARVFAPILPPLRNIRLQLLHLKRRALQPLAPAHMQLELMLRIADLEAKQ